MTTGAPQCQESTVTLQLLRSQRVALSAQVTVKAAVGRDERVFKSRNGIGDRVGRNVPAVADLELSRIHRVGTQHGQHIGPVGRHFQRALDGACGLLGQVAGPTVPELHKVEVRIEHRGGVHRARATLHADCRSQTVHATRFEVVTAQA